MASGAPQSDDVNTLAPIASEQSKASHDDVLSARLMICAKAIGAQVGPDKLRTRMASKKFSEKTQTETLDVCSALATGIAIGVASSEGDAKKDTI